MNLKQTSKEIGIRLAQERRKLGLSQEELAKLADSTNQSQSNYELGKRYPNAKYFALIANLGADIQYIVTGLRSINWHMNSLKNKTKVTKDELMDTLELIKTQGERGLELIKKL